MNKALFILRHSDAPSKNYTASAENGVSLSTYLIVNALRENHVKCSIAAVAAPDEISHVVDIHNPKIVVIETLWVDPKYFTDLVTQYPDITWIVREHSDSSFRVYEENAFAWILEYMKLGVEVMCNSIKSVSDVIGMAEAAGINSDLVSYGPNIYPAPRKESLKVDRRQGNTVNIGCFGAVRPMKNHITQALAAAIFSNACDVHVNFHINGYDIPGYVDPILNNLRNMFAQFPKCTLIEHGWMSHSDFLGVLDNIDICSQVSFTETFNIVAADAMSRGVPLVTSSEVPWIGNYAHRDTTSAEDIADGFFKIWEEPHHDHVERIYAQRADMETYSERAVEIWLARLSPYMFTSPL